MNNGIPQIDINYLSNQLQKINESFENINRGGCGKFALILGKFLQKHGLKVKYILISRKYTNFIESNRKVNAAINTGNFKSLLDNGSGYEVAHVMLYWRGCYIDSTGVFKSIPDFWTSREFEPTAIIPEHVLKGWCRRGGWNYSFDTAQMPAIRRRINKLHLLQAA